MFGEDEIDRMRRLGLTERSPGGVETVRLTVQCRKSVAAQSRESWRDELLDWQRDIGRRLEAHGARLVEDSLSVSAQTIEVIVPIDELDGFVEEMSGCEARVDLLRPRRAVD